MRFTVAWLSAGRVGLVLALVGCWSLNAGSAALANPLSFKVGDPKGRDSVSFTSDAPIELIQGHTNKITGKVVIDQSLDLGKKPLEAEFSVDLASIDTGIPLRNEHMRDKFLQTKQYPNATFKLKTLTAVPTVLKSGEKTNVDAMGDFTLHGKTVSRKIPVQVTFYQNCKATDQKFANCDLLQIRATFPVSFADYNIQRPEIIFQKLADTVSVNVAATAFIPTSAQKPKTSSVK